MKRSALLTVLIAGVALAGCSQSQTASEPSASVSVPKPKPSMTTAAPTTAPATTAAPTSAAPTQSASSAVPGDKAFCNYLKKTQGAQQIVEDPTQYVALVEGAAALAPGAIAEDAALYAESARKLAVTVTGSQSQAAKADQWLSENSDAVDQAEANLNSYAESTCGVPFISGAQ